MNHRQTRFERSAEGSFPYWVCLIVEKCTGPNYEKVQEFCRANGLTLSRNGHSVVWQKEWYQVFRFADEQHAETFMKEFGGERMPPQKEARANAGLIGKRGHTNRSPEVRMTSARRQWRLSSFGLQKFVKDWFLRERAQKRRIGLKGRDCTHGPARPLP